MTRRLEPFVPARVREGRRLRVRPHAVQRRARRARPGEPRLRHPRAPPARPRIRGDVRAERDGRRRQDPRVAHRASGEEPLALSARMAAVIETEMRAIGMLPPDVEPRVSEHIGDIIRLIETLIAKGVAYVLRHAKGVDVYFSVRELPRRTASSRTATSTTCSPGARVEVTVDVKRDPLDFALWKGSERRRGAGTSPWGKGRPGWHIECSAMALEVPRPALRHPRRGDGPHLPAPRERDCAERGRLGRAVRALLDAQRFRERRQRRR